MKTLIIGCQGYVGRHLMAAYAEHATGTHHTAQGGLHLLDLFSPNLEALPLDWKDYTHAIIASGISKIGQCQAEEKHTYQCNVEGTLSVARQLTQRGIFPIFFSSDYVFDGTSSPYDESSALSPLNEYGRQKAILETEIPLICKNRYLMIRLGKVFGIQAGDRTLFDEMASLLISKRPLKCAHDQVFTPIFIDDVVQAILTLQKRGAHGLYNLCSSETWSRYDLACEVARSLKMDETAIHRISIDDLNESFKRPKKTAMRNDKYREATGLEQKSIRSRIQELTTQYKMKVLC